MFLFLILIGPMLLTMLVLQAFCYRAGFALLRLEKGSWLAAIEVGLIAIFVTIATETLFYLCATNDVSIPLAAEIGLSLGAQTITLFYLRWRLATTVKWAFTSMLIAMAIGIVPGVTSALLFRAYWAQAFVVPTGSMTPTILPNHYVIACDDGSELMVSARDVDQVRNYEDARGPKLRCPCQADEFTPDYANLPVVSGDRFLVEQLGMPRRRWDLIVFRHPEGERELRLSRLIGLPGETISIRAGEIWQGDAVVAKPTELHHDLWFPVYLVDQEAPWETINSWLHVAAEEGSVWQDGAWTVSAADSHLQLRGQIRDNWSYNQVGGGDVNTLLPRTVADLRMDLTADQLGEQPLEITCDYYGTPIVWKLAAGKSISASYGERNFASSEAGPLQPGDRISLALRDGSLYVLQNDEVALYEPAIAAPPEEIDLTNVDREITISAGKGWRVADLQLFRDVYYRDAEEMDTGIGYQGAQHDAWHLGPDELVLLGDNSGRSADSRFQSQRTTQGDVVGRVSFVYWPPSRVRIFP